MAEPCVESSLEEREVRSPQSPSFVSFRDQGHTPKLKAFIMSRVNKEESPRPTVISKPMPPLEPLDYSSKVAHQYCPSPLARLHPKKRPRLDAGGELDQQQQQAFPASPPLSPFLPGKLEERDEGRGRVRPASSRPDKDCFQQMNDSFPPYLLSPTLSHSSTPCTYTSRSPSSFSVESPGTFSAFSRVSPSCLSPEDITLLDGRKRSRSPDRDALSFPALKRACPDGFALDLSTSAQVTPLESSYHRTTSVSGHGHGVASGESQDEAYGPCQPAGNRAGLYVHFRQTRGAVSGYPPVPVGGVVYPYGQRAPGQQGSVIQLAGPPGQPRGVTRPPGQPQGVTRPPGHPQDVTRPPGQPQGVTRPPGQPQGVTRPPGQPQGVTRPPGQSQGVTHLYGQPRGVTHLHGHPRGVTHPPGQPQGVIYPPGHPRSVTHPHGHPRSVTHPHGHPRGVTHAPGQAGSVITHTPDHTRGQVGQRWSGGSVEQPEPGCHSLLSHLMGAGYPGRPPYTLGYDYDRAAEGLGGAEPRLTRVASPGAGEGGPGRLPIRLHARQQLHKAFPPPLHASGNQSRRMPSEISYGYPSSLDVPTALLHMPSASSKNFEWDHVNTEVRFQTIPPAKWKYHDVVDFMFAAVKDLKLANQDISFTKLNGVTGSHLLQLDENDFEQFCKNHGDRLYRYFQEYRAKDERRQSQVESRLQFFTNSQLYTSAFELNGDKCTRPPGYYETIDYRGLNFEDSSSRNLLSSDKLPSAALKSFAPLNSMSPTGLPNGTAENMSDPEQSTSEEEPRPEPPKKRGPGRPRKPENELKKKKKKTGRLWEFIRNLLLDPATCPSLVRWENPEEGTFRFVQAEKVAQKWGDRKQNRDMNYEKLSRAMRYYYKTRIFEAVLGRRLVYKFGKNAKDWRPSNPNFPNLQTH